MLILNTWKHNISTQNKTPEDVVLLTGTPSLSFSTIHWAGLIILKVGGADNFEVNGTDFNPHINCVTTLLVASVYLSHYHFHSQHSDDDRVKSIPARQWKSKHAYMVRSPLLLKAHNY